MAPTTKPIVQTSTYKVSINISHVKPTKGAKNKSVCEPETVITKNIRYKNGQDRATTEVQLTVSHDAGSEDFVEDQLVDAIKRGIEAVILSRRVKVEDLSSEDEEEEEEEEEEDEVPEEEVPPAFRKGKKAASSSIIVKAKEADVVVASKGKKKKSAVKFVDENNNIVVEAEPVRRTLRSDKEKKLVPALTFAKGQRPI